MIKRDRSYLLLCSSSFLWGCQLTCHAVLLTEGGGGRVGGRAFDPDDRCYKCGERGHYAYDCRRYTGGSSSRRRSRSRSYERRRRSRSRSDSPRRRSRSPYRRSRSRSVLKTSCIPAEAATSLPVLRRPFVRSEHAGVCSCFQIAIALFPLTLKEQVSGRHMCASFQHMKRDRLHAACNVITVERDYSTIA